MAQIKSTGTVEVELTAAELALVRRSLRLVRNFGEVEDWDEAENLLADLDVVK